MADKARQLKIMAGIFLISLIPFAAAYADMGRIYATDAKVMEDSQKAIILHNLDEEILILGTDLKADKNTSVIRFIPFPAEPKVSLAQPKAFDVAAVLIEKHGLKFINQYKGGGPSAQAVELRFNQKLGAHDIAVVKINDSAGFRKWVNDFFKSKGLPQKPSYSEIENIVDDYTKRGIVYFVFDLVEVTAETRFIEPIQYRFKSKELYYPLKTSNTFGGNGTIDLIMILPGTLCQPLYTNFYNMKATTSSAVTMEELKDILPAPEEFFAGKNLFIQLARYWGQYKFGDDIFYDLSKIKPNAISFEAEDDWHYALEDMVKSIPERFPESKQSDAK